MLHKIVQVVSWPVRISCRSIRAAFRRSARTAAYKWVIQRVLRRASVAVLLSMAGIILSAAALLILIGIGQVQIRASLHGSGDLFANWWFDVGGLVGIAGLVCGAVAVSCIGSQAKARREFPDLLIKVDEWSPIREFDYPSRSNPSEITKGRIVHLRVRVTNNDRNRNANLSMWLWCFLEPGVGNRIEEWAFEPADRWLVEHCPDDYSQLADPVLHLGPESTRMGDLVFDLSRPFGGVIDRKLQQWVEVEDHLSQRSIFFPFRFGRFSSANWRTDTSREAVKITEPEES